jgi:exopolysaccharide production protein ExoQ
MAWAPSMNEAIRKGVLTGLAATVAIYAASRLSSRHILMAYFFGELIGATLSLATPNPTSFGAWTGVFGQKNFMAGHMFILYAAALALLLDKKSRPWLRLTTLVGAAMAALLILMAQSATTTILTAAATVVLAMHALFWQPAVRIRHMRMLIVLAIAVLGASACLLLFGLFQIDAWDSLLASMGKDSTLTGRTFLWQIADRVMAEHPWTGLGANGFWRPELGAANEITRYFHYEAFTKFSFHNSYRENGVQFGYPGFYATYFLAGWGLISAAIIWLRNQTIANATFLVLAVLVILRSNTETDLAGELGATMILFFIAALRGKESSSDPAGASSPPSAHSPRPAR